MGLLIGNASSGRKIPSINQKVGLVNVNVVLYVDEIKGVISSDRINANYVMKIDVVCVLLSLLYIVAIVYVNLLNDSIIK